MAFLMPTRITLLKICILLCAFCACFVLFRVNDSIGNAGSNSLAFGFKARNSEKVSSLLRSFNLGTGAKSSNETWIDALNLLFIFTRANEVKFLEQKFSRCLNSLFRKTNSSLYINVITDLRSLHVAEQVIRFAAFKTSVPEIKVDLHNVEYIVEPLRDIVAFLQPHFSYKPGAYYSDALFFLSIAIHNVFPHKKLLMIDIDTKFLADVKELYNHFEFFDSTSVMGLAHEQQPVYFHLLRDYRMQHPGTKAGGHTANGDVPGFNSGIILLHLERMRNSALYNSYINATVVDVLAQTYQFKGHLGDQDFFTLLSFVQPQLFYILPCYWNRQLCQWWKYHGYNHVFHKFYQCDEPIKLFHGNCNSAIPDD